MVHWGEVFLRFRSAAQVYAVLEAFGAVCGGLRGVRGAVPSGSAVGDVGWPWVSVLSVTCSRLLGWCVVCEVRWGVVRWGVVRGRVVRWVGVGMGPVLWWVVGWAGYGVALELLRNVLRASVACFLDGGRFRLDPSKVGVLMVEAESVG